MNELNKAWWWGNDHEFIWDHIKLSMRNNWERTRHSSLTHQSSNQTTSRINVGTGGLPTFEEVETACRFGYGAHLEYDCDYPEWNAGLEIELARDWESLNSSRLTTWEEARSATRFGWNFEGTNLTPINRAPRKPVHNHRATEAMPQILESMTGAKWIRPKGKDQIKSFPHIQSPSEKAESVLV